MARRADEEDAFPILIKEIITIIIEESVSVGKRERDKHSPHGQSTLVSRRMEAITRAFNTNQEPHCFTHVRAQYYGTMIAYVS